MNLLRLIICFAVFFSFSAGDVFAQESIISFDQIEKEGFANITDYEKLDSLERIPYFNSLFKIETPLGGRELQPKTAILKQFSISNSSEDTQSVKIVFAANDFNLITSTQNSGESKSFFTGKFFEDQNYLSKGTEQFIIIPLKPKDTVQIHYYAAALKGSLLHKSLYITTNNEEISAAERVSIINKNANAIHLIYQGALWFSFLFMMFLWLINRELAFLYYGIYLFFVASYLLIRFPIGVSMLYTFGNGALISAALNEPIQFIFFVFYNLFAIHFLQLKTQSPRLYITLKWVNVVFVIYAASAILYYLFTLENISSTTIFAVTRGVLIVFNIIFIVYLSRTVKLPYTKFFVLGSSFFLLGGIIAAVNTMIPISISEYLNIVPINYFEIGVLLEATVFGFGLGYRLKITQDERNAAHKAYVEQIEINQQIQANIKNDLERQIVKRTNEILAIQNEVEIHREMQLRTNFEKRISELEMQALRAQMNPHFLFNGLNSLKNFIIKNNNERAVTYLNRFSKLLRMILQLSRSETISLAQELEALKLYVFIEQERLDHKFTFEIFIDSGIRVEDIEIPPLMLQPHIENAIWHGLMPKESGGWVKINIETLEDQEIKVSIQDNGVGRGLKSTTKLDHKPLGHKITQDRIELHNKIYSNKIHLEMVDLVDQNGESAGTQVIFIIKPC